MFKSINTLQQRDACLALAFLLLLVWLFGRNAVFVYLAMAALLLGMIWPAAMKPFAFIWYRLAEALGRFTSAILVGIIWVVLVLPVGVIRRWLGKDPLRLREWHAGRQSCLIMRRHVYTADDLKHPY